MMINKLQNGSKSESANAKIIVGIPNSKYCCRRFFLSLFMNKSLNQQSPKKDLYYLNITNENITCRKSGLHYENCNFIVMYNVFDKYPVVFIK